MMTEKVMSYIYKKPFKVNIADGGNIYWNQFYEDLYTTSVKDLNKYHNPGRLLFPTRIDRVSLWVLIKSIFNKKCKLISPSI